ncbi:MAG: hypothetical protein NWF00_01835 [Candidatus Bathyarchaeota archaeon]|nr:hypothetical protein [Candidatus Bathyarchaeota archaeon]
MGTLKSLQNRIHGWLPKEPNVAIQKQTNSHKPPITGVQLGIIMVMLGFAGSFLGALDATLGLGLFSGLGVYISIALLIVCIAVAAVTTILRHNKKRNAKT